MTNDTTKNALMESSDTKSSILAAIARIEAVPAGSTLIDLISNDDWCDNSVGNWKIEAGSDEAGPSEELDESDKEIVKVA